MKRLVLVTGSYPPLRCGVGDYTQNLAHSLASQDLEVHIMTSSNLPMTAGSDPVRFHPVVVSWRHAGLSSVVDRLLRLEPDIVHLQYPTCTYQHAQGPLELLPRLRQHAPGVLRVLTLHEFAQHRFLGKWRLRVMLEASQVIVCTNHTDRRALRNFIPSLSRRLHVVPLGSNVGEASCTPRVLPEKAGLRWMAHFGTVMPNKGWETLLLAWQQLQEQGCGYGLEVVGELNSQLAYPRQIGQQIRQRGLQACIRFTGYLSPADASQRLGQHAMAVLPFTQGVSLNRGSLVAALAHRLAVVSTSPKQPQERLRHGSHLWLVKPGDAQALAQAIQRVAEDAPLRETLRAGADAVAQRFAWPRLGQRNRQLYASGSMEAEK